LAASDQTAGLDTLVQAARAARDRAIAPYSRFRVGAALQTTDGLVIVAGNIENASYGLTMCAERVALLKALSDGQAAFSMIAVAADTPTPTPPCGACRQFLWEYCGDIPVVLANLTTHAPAVQLAELLPRPFDRRFL
jgi:cytidine deaminase